MDEIRQLFTKLDKNEDGELSREEWADGIKNYYANASFRAFEKQMKQMLRARHARRKYGTGCVPLTIKETEFVNNEGLLTQTLYANMYAWFKGHGVKIDTGVEQPAEVK